VFRLAYRQAEGLIGSIISSLGMTLRVPDHTTLSRRSATLAVPRLARVGADGDARPSYLVGRHRHSARGDHGDARGRHSRPMARPSTMCGILRPTTLWDRSWPLPAWGSSRVDCGA
jgi:hypothetical protein